MRSAERQAPEVGRHGQPGGAERARRNASTRDAALLALQRAVGNRAVTGLVRGAEGEADTRQARLVALAGGGSPRHDAIPVQRAKPFRKLKGKVLEAVGKEQLSADEIADEASAVLQSADEEALLKFVKKWRKLKRSWLVLREALGQAPANVKQLIRTKPAVLGAFFAVAPSARQKAELIYHLGGTDGWKRDQMVRQKVDIEDYRKALVRLKVFEAGTAAHKSGPEVDQLVETKLSAFVSTDIDKRGRITGKLAVLGEADWNVVGRNEYGDDWADKKLRLNAYVDRAVDPPRVFVNKDRGNAGTAIHEACHVWGSSACPIAGACHDLNEGITEYFARKVCADLGISRSVYAKQVRVATQLVDLVGEPRVAAAFWDGDLNGLITAFDGVQGAGSWNTFVQQIENKQWNAACQAATP